MPSSVWCSGRLLFVLGAAAVGSCTCTEATIVEMDSGVAGGDGGMDGGALGCPAACGASELCSVVGSCIPLGTCAANGDCSAGTVCKMTDKVCVPGSECGSQEVTGGLVEPNLLITLDRSCSMQQLVNGKSKWGIAVDALGKLVSSNAGKIFFGLALFPDTDSDRCAQGAISIPVGSGKEGQIQALLTSALATSDPYYPDYPCITNIDTAMQQAAGEPAFNDSTRKSFVLLISDGAQSGCNPDAGDAVTTRVIADLFQNRGIATFVVGFGGGVDRAQLNIFADAGGMPTGDPMARYYKAEDEASLNAALQSIAGRALGCSYTLSQTPPDTNALHVFFDNVRQVPRDGTHADGWDYDGAINQVRFFGPACEELRQGKVADLDIVFGCPTPSMN